MKVVKKSVNGYVKLSFEDFPEIEFFIGECFSSYCITSLNLSLKSDFAHNVLCDHICDRITHGDITINTEPFTENTQTYRIAEIIKDRYQKYINQYNKIKRLETEPDIVEFEI